MPEGTKLSNGPLPAHPDGIVDDARWLFPQERAPPPRDEGCEHNCFVHPVHSLSKGGRRGPPLRWLDLTGAPRHRGRQGALRVRRPQLNRCYEAWQAALALVRSSDETRSRHQAILSLERDTVACKHLRQVHLRWYVVAMLKASFDTICQSTAACVNTSIATGPDVAIHRISAERDFCVAPLDAVLAEIAHIVVVQDKLSRMMSPACLPRSSAQVMTPPSPTTMTPSSPPSHTHPTS
jgi:hypothetical protein